MEQKSFQYQVKRWPLSTSRQLTIDPLYIELEGPLTNMRFTKEDIEGFRYGVRYFHYYVIPVGRNYNIEIKNSLGKVLLVRMHSVFGIGNKRIEKLFVQIHKQIHEAYFMDMAIHYLRLLKSGLTYELAGTMLTHEGVIIKKDSQLIPWIRVGLMSYYRSCSIYDLTDPKRFRSFDYWQDWNASLLHTIVEYKLQSTTYEMLK